MTNKEFEEASTLNDKVRGLAGEVFLWLDNARILKIYAEMAHVIIDAGLDPSDLDNAGGAYLDISRDVYNKFAVKHLAMVNKLGDALVGIVLRASVYGRIMDKPSEYLDVMSKCAEINEERKKGRTCR
jgi:hypothetical protein|nr:MAG TPA: hypothetical protein [Caudoviricetes sp.]